MLKPKKLNLLTYLILSVGVAVLALPIYLTLVNAFKDTRQITTQFFALPNPFTLDNFTRLIGDGVQTYFANSIIITIFSNLLILLVIPMAGFALQRKMERNKIFMVIYFFLILAIFVPFQVIMIPMTTLMLNLGLSNRTGLIILYLAYATPQTLFLYIGYIKSVVPEELDEAAYIDGCGRFRIYFSIIFPLLKPMHATVLILNALWTWNDFLLPLLLLNRDASSWTLPLFQFNYQSQYFNDFGPSFAAYVAGIVPIMVIYLIFQKHIIAGMTSGSIK